MPQFDPVISAWKVLLFLAIAGIIATASFNAYLLKHNRILMFQRDQQTEQLQKIQQADATLRSLLQDVANFSANYPEVRLILGKYGLKVENAPVAPLPPK